MTNFFLRRPLLFNLKAFLTNDCDGEYPEEEPVEHHGHVLPVLPHLVGVFLPPGCKSDNDVTLFSDSGF